jgi:hypothetical protein
VWLFDDIKEEDEADRSAMDDGRMGMVMMIITL